MFIPTEKLTLVDNDLGTCPGLHIQKHKCEHCLNERFSTSYNDTHSNNLCAI